MLFPCVIKTSWLHHLHTLLPKYHEKLCKREICTYVIQEQIKREIFPHVTGEKNKHAKGGGRENTQ